MPQRFDVVIWSSWDRYPACRKVAPIPPFGGKGHPLRQIGRLPRELDPKIFADHLLAQGIKSKIDDRPDGWVVWVYDENHLARAGDELKAYLAAPDDARYEASALSAKEARREEQLREKEFRKNYRDVSSEWAAPSFRRRPVTMTLAIISVVVYVLQNWSFFDLPLWPELGFKTVDTLMFSSYPETVEELRGGPAGRWLLDIRHGQLWRLITPIFLHFGLIHIVFNMSWLLSLGTMIELRRNSRVLALLVLLAAVASNLGQYLYMERAEQVFPAFGGMSGVVYGLFGYVWAKGHYEPEQGMALHQSTINIMLIWLVLCMTGVLGPIANAAHLIGLVAGVLLGIARL